ncbi:MAG: hypothetical protein GEV28_32105 [Actinophytocola sp.]|uniref:papain-like cysteine protease family protein n=1 Tax=Actinophytocola sp. TaxID=1872138 RepID=UPI00132A10D9|nr:papain-like cysteine protease family protein [Actinophytocola sp.]MPZ84778.1 hypothetical protein [Actinophytocola sp.]
MAEPAKKAPTISKTENNTNTGWVMYLQQLLNYFYKTQVVTEDGMYGPTTDNAVAHFRELHQYSGEPVVDAEIWKLLGHEEKQLENVDKQVTLVEATDQSLSWAASFAMVLNAKGGNHEVNGLVTQVHAPESGVAAHQAKEYATTLGLTPINCNLDDAPSWSTVLKTHGPAWFPSQADDHYVVVISGIRKQDEEVQIHVNDPTARNEQWTKFEEFMSAFGIGDQSEYEVLVAG